MRVEFRKYPLELPELTSPNWNSWPEIMKQGYAEAVLRQAFLQNKQPFRLPQECLMYHPFGQGTPSVETLLQCRGAVVQFPVCSDSVSKIYYMYLLENKGQILSDHSSYLEKTEIIRKDTSIYISHDFSPLASAIKGYSWQLAYWMAYRAILWNEEKYKEKLCRFLITGAVESEKVRKVIIGKKPELLKCHSEMKFLYPEENSLEITGDKQRFIPVGDVDQAWRAICGVGYEETQLPLPEQIELHILVGGDKKHIKTSILTLNPIKVYFWCSQKTTTDACEIQKELEQYLPDTVFEQRIMDSHNLQACYADLSEVIEKIPQKENAVICYTGGNRLMGSAALLVAQTYHLAAVYRDVDAEKFYLTVSAFIDGKWNFSDQKINRCPVSEKIDWEDLYSKSFR